MSIVSPGHGGRKEEQREEAELVLDPEACFEVQVHEPEHYKRTGTMIVPPQTTGWTV